MRMMTGIVSTIRLRFLPFSLESILRFLSKQIEKYSTNDYIIKIFKMKNCLCDIVASDKYFTIDWEKRFLANKL